MAIMIDIGIEIIHEVLGKCETLICKEIQEGGVIVHHQGMVINKEITDNNMNQTDIAEIFLTIEEMAETLTARREECSMKIKRKNKWINKNHLISNKIKCKHSKEVCLVIKTNLLNNNSHHNSLHCLNSSSSISSNRLNQANHNNNNNRNPQDKHNHHSSNHSHRFLKVRG